MRRPLLSGLAAAAVVLGLIVPAAPPTARADFGVDTQPVGSVSVPPGPAPTWIVADMDSGQVLAARDMDIRHPPASTIKTLLALTALDELPDLDATVAATEAATRVECNCAGVEPGRSYTARQLLDAVLLVSGNDAANTLADLLGGHDVAVAKMNAKAAAVGAFNTYATTPSGLDGADGPGSTTPHDLAIIFRAAMANPMFAHITAQRSAPFPAASGERILINQNELLNRYPGAIGGKTGFTDAARKTYVGAAQRGSRHLVVALMYGLVREGGPTYWDQAAGLLDWGFAQDGHTGIGVL